MRQWLRDMPEPVAWVFWAALAAIWITLLIEGLYFMAAGFAAVAVALVIWAGVTG